MPSHVKPSKKTVLVTGFGPFGVYKVNTSWEAVKELYKEGLGADWELVIYEIPVEYCTVKSIVPQLWEQYNPDVFIRKLLRRLVGLICVNPVANTATSVEISSLLFLNEIGTKLTYNISVTAPDLKILVFSQLVVHVGVSGIASELTLEQKAFNYGYERKDVNNCLPEDNCCVNGADECITAGIKMNIVCADINNSDSKIKAVVSHDAGRYLCDFSYFTSLHINKYRTAFIHVPPMDQPYTVQELAEGLKVAITAMLKQIEEKLEMVEENSK